MKKHLPLVLMGLGLFIFIAGFGYNLMFAGIPYQDPTPEMSARYDFHARIASNLYFLGGVTLLVGAAVGVLRVIARRLAPPQAS